MIHDDRSALQVLKSELAFLEKGGYRKVPRHPWRPNFVFQDSPTCINFQDRGNPLPCTECLLIQFVPQDRVETRFPCRHIHLTPGGDTVSSLYEWGTEEELESALKAWLKKTIEQLESESGARSQKA
jgi:hypothetical protein